MRWPGFGISLVRAGEVRIGQRWVASWNHVIRVVNGVRDSVKSVCNLEESVPAQEGQVRLSTGCVLLSESGQLVVAAVDLCWRAEVMGPEILSGRPQNLDVRANRQNMINDTVGVFDYRGEKICFFLAANHIGGPAAQPIILPHLHV